MEKNNFINLYEKQLEEIFIVTRGSKYNEDGVEYTTLYKDKLISMKNEFKASLEGFEVEYGYISQEMICFVIMSQFDKLKPIKNIQGCLDISKKILDEIYIGE